jgi:hypothetical protein
MTAREAASLDIIGQAAQRVDSNGYAQFFTLREPDVIVVETNLQNDAGDYLYLRTESTADVLELNDWEPLPREPEPDPEPRNRIRCRATATVPKGHQRKGKTKR